MKPKAHLLNETMLDLVAAGSHFPLGIKVWQIREYLHRDEYPISPEAFVGMEGDKQGYCLLDHYVDLQGYQFSWGMLAESGDELDPEECEEPMLIYEVVPERVLIQYPRSDRLDTVFYSMYEVHPLFDERFEYDLGELGESVLFFKAHGEKEVAELRAWMARVFLPQILPDILATVQMLLDLREVDENEFEVQCEKWTGGDYDHRHMSLNSNQSQSSGIH